MMRSTNELRGAENFFSSNAGVQRLTPAEIEAMSPLAVMLWVMRHFMRVGRYEAAAHAASLAAPYTDRPLAARQEAERAGAAC